MRFYNWFICKLFGDQDDYFWHTPTEKITNEKAQSKEKTLDIITFGGLPYETPISILDSNTYRDNLAGFASRGEKQETTKRLDEQKDEKKSGNPPGFKFDR